MPPDKRETARTGTEPLSGESTSTGQEEVDTQGSYLADRSTTPRDEMIVALANLIATGLVEGETPAGLMLGYAISYAAAGWKVFPLGRNKRPRIPSPHPKGYRCKGECGLRGHGVHDATTNIATVCQWWASDYRGAGIGAAIPSGMFVLDTDPRKPGYIAAAQLLARYGTLPATLMTLSGRLDGGVHYFYRAPAGELAGRLLVPGFEGIAEPGFDLKSAGGYVVMAPTPHPVTGRPYTAVDAPIADAGWLGRFVVKPRRSAPAASSSRKFFNRPGVSPADWYTDSHSWAEVLGPHGWSCPGGIGDDDGDVWLHPTHTSGCSATISKGCLFVYSTSTAFEPTTPGDPHGYTKFRAYAVLNFRGDLSAAAQSLRKAV
jgi:Bifunctional DNA primase/polymerase, N-terminal